MSLHLEKCLSYLRKPFVTFRWLHCHPYSWVKPNDGPTLNNIRTSRFLWQFNVALVIGYYGFVVCRSVQVFRNANSTLMDKSYMCFPLLLFSGFIGHHVFILARRTEFLDFFKGFIKLIRDVKLSVSLLNSTFSDLDAHFDFLADIHTDAQKVRVHVCQLLMTMFGITCHVTAAGVICHMIARPSSPDSVSSRIMDFREPVRTAGRYVLSVLQAYLRLCSIEVLPVVICPTIFFMFSVPELLREQVWVDFSTCCYAFVQTIARGDWFVLVELSSRATLAEVRILTIGNVF